jgi:hypothetical protein
MKSRPILFSAPMVRALLAGTKTQTRRVAKFNYAGRLGKAGRQWHRDDPAAVNACPYGQPGDRLWVKETHRFGIAWDKSKPTEIPTVAAIRYEADGVIRTTGQKLETGKARPSLFMRQAFSRLTLEITEIRVERLQAITEADALAEGVTPAVVPGHYNIIAESYNCQVVEGFVGGIPKPGDEWQGQHVEHVQHIPAKQVGTARDAYRVLWEQLNGAGSWALNPYVWVLTFRRVTP